MRPDVFVNCIGLGLFADDFYGPKPAVLGVFASEAYSEFCRLSI